MSLKAKFLLLIWLREKTTIFSEFPEIKDKVVRFLIEGSLKGGTSYSHHLRRGELVWALLSPQMVLFLKCGVLDSLP